MRHSTFESFEREFTCLPLATLLGSEVFGDFGILLLRQAFRPFGRGSVNLVERREVGPTRDGGFEEIETLTGIDFFVNLKDEYQKAAEAKYDASSWGL